MAVFNAKRIPKLCCCCCRLGKRPLPCPSSVSHGAGSCWHSVVPGRGADHAEATVAQSTTLLSFCGGKIAGFLHGLITCKNGRGKKRSGQPAGTCDRRRKVFVHPKSLRVETSKRCTDSGRGAPARFSSPAALERRAGADQNPHGFVPHPQLSPAHKRLWVFLLVFSLFSSEAGKWRYCFLRPFPVCRRHAACGVTFPAPEARMGWSDTVLWLLVNAACLCFSLISFYKIPNEKNYGRTNGYFPSFVSFCLIKCVCTVV